MSWVDVLYTTHLIQGLLSRRIHQSTRFLLGPIINPEQVSKTIKTGSESVSTKYFERRIIFALKKDGSYDDLYPSMCNRRIHCCPM